MTSFRQLSISIFLIGLTASLLVIEPGCSREDRSEPAIFIDPGVRTALAPFATEKPDRRKRRTLVIGWDGASYRYIDPLIEEGRLPNLHGLMDRGVQATLESTLLPISSAAWTSAVTGKSPSKTGIFSFFERVPGSYGVRVISSLDRKASPLWRILNHHGKNAVVFGMPVTYPPEPVKTIMVSGMLSPEQADYAWPPGLADALRSVQFIPDLGIWREKRTLSRNILYGQLEIKKHALTTLLTGNDWDLAFIVFKSLDVLKHRGVTEPNLSNVLELYDYLDKTLGLLIRVAGPNTDIIVLSDHGFQSFTKAFNINGWLLEKGFAVPALDGIPSEPDKTTPIAIARAASHNFHMAKLNLYRTVAITGPAEGSFGSIRVNLQGREPRGAATSEQYETLLQAIEDSLMATKNPFSDGPLVRRVMRTAEVYPGPYLESLPEILFEVDHDFLVRPFTVVPAVQSIRSPAADHELNGIFVAAGPSFLEIADRRHASILDLCPTLLHISDLPVYDEMDGHVLTELLSVRRKVRVEVEPAELQETGPGATYTAKELRELEERLRSMAYTR